MTHDGISVESSFNDAAQTLNNLQDPLDNIVVFQKRDGTTNQGTNYEVYVTSLVALRLALDDDVQDFLIASNHPDYGAFDDIIVQEQRVGHAKKNYAVQLKHKAKQKPIGTTFFTSEDFCILKYKESFLDVAKSVDGESTTFCLFTNSVVEEEKLKRMRFKLREHLKKADCDFCAEFPEKHHHSASLHFTIQPSPSNARDFLGTKGNCYDLVIHSSNDSESTAQLHGYAEFFGKFKLYAGQMSSEEVKLRITDEFMEKFGTSAQEVGEKFISFVDDWFFKKGESGWLSKAHAKLKILELLLTPFLIEPTITGVHLQQSSLWNAVVACANVTVVNGDVEDADCLSKIYGAIEEKMRDALHVAVNLRNWMEYVPKDVEEVLKGKKLGSVLNTVPEHGRINSKRLLIASWKMGLVPLVLRVSQSNRNYLTAALNAMSVGFNGLYVFVGKPPGKLKPGLKVLTDMSVDKTITKTVKVLKYISKYLTKHPINFTVLEEMMGTLSDKVSKLRNPMGLHTSLGGINQAIKILQTAQKRLRSLYTHTSAVLKNKTKKMNRAFRKIHAALLKIKTESLKYFGVDANHLQNRILHAAKLSPQGRRSLTLFDFCESRTKSLNKIMRRITPSLLLRLLDTSQCYCVGAKLKENAADYISRNFKWRRLITNEVDLFIKFKNDINVISGDPGMGKTTTLKSLAFHCNPRYWVLLINLNKIQEDFFNVARSAGGVLDDPIWYLFEKLEHNAGAFTRALFSNLRKRRKVLVILDSFDEVSPKYNEVVINLMKKIQKEGLQVWIATRPFAKSFIENAFSVHTIYMLGFTEQDFRNYLSLHEVSARDKDFILANIDKHFYTVPLHAYMLTTVKNFNEQFEITDVYEKFIDQKFDTFCRKHDLLQCKNNMDVLIKASKKELIKNHEVMALAVIYGVEFFKIAIAMNHEKLVKNFEEAVQTTENCKNPLGLVVGVSNQIPVFIHKSYAEYMAAKWLSKNITRASVDYTPDIYSKLNPYCATNSDTVVFRDVKLYEKLFSPGHKLVRSMFDKIAAKEKPLHLAVLNSNLDGVKTLCAAVGNEMDLDKFGRTPLHLAVAVFDPHATFMSSCGEIIKCQILRVLVEHFGRTDFLVKDAFGWDFLQYAKLSGNEDLPHVAAHHGELKGLSLFLDHLPEAELQQTINKKNAHNMTLLNIATARGHANIVEYLIGKGADVEGRDMTGNTPLQVACKNGYLELVGFLLEAGVKKDTFNQFGNAPLHSAAKHGHFDVVRLLVEVGSDVNVCNNSRETPLHVAAANGHLHIVEFLVDGGADVIAEDVNASTPSYMAAERGHVNVVKCLIEKEAQNYKGFISQDFVDGSIEINKESRAGDTEEYLSVLATLHALKFALCDDNKEVLVSFNVEEYGEFGSLIVQRARDEMSETFAMSFVRCTEGVPLEFDFRQIGHCYGHMKKALKEPCSLRFCLHVDCASVSDELEDCEDAFALTGRRCYKYAAKTDGQEELLSKLWFYYGPFDCETVINSIGSLLEEAGFGQIDEDVVENVVANFRPRKECRLLMMNKDSIKVKLLECLLTPFMVEPEIYVPLGINELVWSDLINDSDVTLISDCSSENWKLVRRIFYTMQVHVRNACKINLNLKLWMQHKAQHPVRRFFPCIKKLMAMLWEKRVLPLFLQINGEDERFLSAVLNKLLLPSSGYKCIVMADDFSRLKLRSDLKVFDSLKIASDAVRTRILQETEVALQGRPSINLHKLTDGFDVDCISSTFLATMNKSNAVCKSLEHRVEFYVNRRFYRTLLRAEVLWKTEGNVFVLDGDLNPAMRRSCCEIGTSVIKRKTNNEKEDVVGSILKAESTNVIVVVNASEATALYDELRSNENLAFLKVHRLRVDGDYLEWLKSSGGVKDLNGFLVQTQTVDEPGLLKCFKNCVNVIGAVAGMGKTIALQSLAWSCEPDRFILPIDLCEYEGEFGRERADLSDDPLDYFYKKLRGDKRATLDEEVFKICKAQKKVVVFMDGFDRMLHYDKDYVLEVVEKLSEENVQVWIATRPIGASHLQEKFNVLPVNLQEINDAEKEYYLHEVLYTPGPQERSVLYSRINTSFYRTPLHLKILAKYLNAEKLSVPRFEWDINWYRCFVREKIRTTYGHWDGFANFEATCTRLCQTLALVSVYGRNFVLSNNTCHEERLDEIVKDVLRRGKDAGFIAAIKDNVPIFTNEVYRDYFLATWLLQNIHYPICREMYRLLFQPGLQSTRRMFDKFAADGCPLHLAVLSNNVSELKRIGKDPKAANVTTKLRDRLGRTPLHLAVSHFEPLEFTAPEHKTSCAIVSLVVDLLKTAEVHLQDNLLEWDWLRYATESGNLELFHLAALHGHVNVMQLFLKNHEAHWNINKASRSGHTALDLAMSEFHVQPIEFLLRNGTPEIVKEANYLKATAADRLDVMKLFLRAGVDVKCTDSNGRQNALHAAALNGSLKCVKYLLSGGLGVDSRTKDERTPLHFAAKNGHLRVVDLLIKMRADVNAADSDGRTPLHLAIINDKENCTSSLLYAHANVNAKDKFGLTPLNVAISKNNQGILALLLTLRCMEVSIELGGSIEGLFKNMPSLQSNNNDDDDSSSDDFEIAEDALIQLN